MLVGWKTVILNLGWSVLGVLVMVDWTSITNNPKISGALISAMGVLNIWMRAKSDTTIFKSTSPAPMPPPGG